MGTSTAYGSPKWPGVNNEVGEAISEGNSREKLSNAVGAFTSWYKRHLNSGTPSRLGTGIAGDGRVTGPRGAGSGATARSRAAVTGARLAGFLANVASEGLNHALLSLNLPDLVGRPLEEVFDAVLDKLCEHGGLLDDVALTNAMARTFDELAEKVETVDEFDELLSAGAENIGEYLQIYFANMLAINFEQKESGFVREHVSRDQCDSFFRQAAELIRAIIREELSKERDIVAIDWNSAEGIAIADSINQEVLDILISK